MLATDRLAAAAALWARAGRELTVRFSGRSMEPTLASDEEVLLRCGVPVAQGDIIAYLATDHVIVHRVVATSEHGRWILTRGDARTLPDVPILRHDAVLGRVAAVRRGGTFVDPAAAPRDPLLRGLVVGLCRATLDLSPRAGAGLLALAIVGRRLLLGAASRVKGRAGSRAPD